MKVDTHLIKVVGRNMRLAAGKAAEWASGASERFKKAEAKAIL